MTVEKTSRRFVAEYVSRELIAAVDVGLLLDVEANLLRSLQHTFPQRTDEAHGRTVLKILRRAWLRVGEDLLGRLAEAELAVGRGPRERTAEDEALQPFSGSGILGS